MKADHRALRRAFFASLFSGLIIVWPVLSVLIGAIIGLGVAIGYLEGWSISDSIYFAFVTGLTIGYGDLAPKLVVARLLAICIGICGLLVTALVAAVAVRALSANVEDQ